MFEYVANTLLLLGGFFTFSGSLGVLRLPDFYSRLHPAGTADTLGQLLVFSGLALKIFFEADVDGLSIGKLLAISLLLFVTTPVSTHAISRVAHLQGLKPWTGPAEEKTDD
jgi:multicomponent Na+:H+ antiporter subunit G